jgi:hypothetical protein
LASRALRGRLAPGGCIRGNGVTLRRRRRRGGLSLGLCVQVLRTPAHLENPRQDVVLVDPSVVRAKIGALRRLALSNLTAVPFAPEQVGCLLVDRIVWQCRIDDGRGSTESPLRLEIALLLSLRLRDPALLLAPQRELVGLSLARLHLLRLQKLLLKAFLVVEFALHQKFLDRVPGESPADGIIEIATIVEKLSPVIVTTVEEAPAVTSLTS